MYDTIYNIVCGIDEYHPIHEFIDFKLFERGKDVTKDYNNIKPDIDNISTELIESICSKCKPKIYKKHGLDKIIKGGGKYDRYVSHSFHR